MTKMFFKQCIRMCGLKGPKGGGGLFFGLGELQGDLGCLSGTDVKKLSGVKKKGILTYFTTMSQHSKDDHHHLHVRALSCRGQRSAHWFLKRTVVSQRDRLRPHVEREME